MGADARMEVDVAIEDDTRARTNDRKARPSTSDVVVSETFSFIFSCDFGNVMTSRN